MILLTLEKADAPEEETYKDKQENFDDITLFDMTKDEFSISLQAPNMSNSNFDDDLDDLEIDIIDLGSSSCVFYLI